MRHGRPKRGSFVVLVGPDGVGKTTLAQRILLRRPGSSLYFHFCPPIKGPFADPIAGEVEAPSHRRGNVVGGWVRILRNAVRFWAGYLATVKPSLRAGKLVVGDRWAYGYIAKPESVRFHGPPWLAKVVVNALPKPDLVVVLKAAPDTIVRRKPELALSEAAEETELWATIPAPRVMILDAEQDPDSLSDEVLEEIRRTHDRSIFIRSFE